MKNEPIVRLYTRVGCCLCEDAQRILESVRGRARFRLEVVDIDADPQLRALYNEEVPVIEIEGRKAFKYRVTAQEFLKRLSART